MSQGFFEHPEYLAVRAHLPAPWQDILDLAYYSGWRKQEILGLTWEEIDKAGADLLFGFISQRYERPQPRGDHESAVRSWVGEAGVRLYSAGQPGGARADRLLHQARLALDRDARLKVVRKMYDMRFGEPAPQRRSVDQLRGIEGARVKRLYQVAQQHGVTWKRRKYDPENWQAADLPNRCLSQATACLYGLAEAAILAAGYAPAVGFLHTGKPLSFVYDVADIYKFETVVPIAFRVAGQAATGKAIGRW